MQYLFEFCSRSRRHAVRLPIATQAGCLPNCRALASSVAVTDGFYGLVIGKPSARRFSMFLDLPCLCRCGHLFCWPCLHAWISEHPTCPVCKDHVDEDRVVPVYTRGDVPSAARARHTHDPGSAVPPRPTGFRLLPPNQAASNRLHTSPMAWLTPQRSLQAPRNRRAVSSALASPAGASSAGVWQWFQARLGLSPTSQTTLTQVLLICGCVFMLLMLLF